MKPLKISYEESKLEHSNNLKYKLMEKALKDVAEDAKSKKGRIPKSAKTAKFLLDEMIAYRSALIAGSSMRELLNPKFIMGLREVIAEKNEKKSRDELIDEISKLSLDVLGLEELHQHTYESYQRVFTYLFDLEVRLSKSGTKRGAKRNELHEEDNRRLLECLEDLKIELQRPLIPTDLLKFIRLVKKKYPYQAYIQKSRLTKDEKYDRIKTPDITQAEKNKSRGKNWSTPRLTKFFNLETGLKGTTKSK
jgi:hypothetical protein